MNRPAEKEATVEITRLGGTFEKKCQSRWSPWRSHVVVVQLAWNKDLNDDHLVFLSALSHLTHLQLRSTGIHGDLLKHLSCAGTLEFLDLGETDVNDSSTEVLTAFANLRWLFFDGTRISDLSMDMVTNMTKLEYLSLNGLLVTLSGVRKLTRLSMTLKILVLGKAGFNERDRDTIERMFTHARIDWV